MEKKSSPRICGTLKFLFRYYPAIFSYSLPRRDRSYGTFITVGSITRSKSSYYRKNVGKAKTYGIFQWRKINTECVRFWRIKSKSGDTEKKYTWLLKCLDVVLEMKILKNVFVRQSIFWSYLLTKLLELCNIGLNWGDTLNKSNWPTKTVSSLLREFKHKNLCECSLLFEISNSIVVIEEKYSLIVMFETQSSASAYLVCENITRISLRGLRRRVWK